MKLSFEFYPPKTDEGLAHLIETAEQLKQFHPEYFSVTFGAGGSTQTFTLNAVAALQKKGLDVSPHLSCIGATQARIEDLLMQYQTQGISRLVALRGDLPSGSGSLAGDFHHASDLVAFIREKTGKHFKIAVGVYPECHPQAINLTQDLDYFKAKVDTGADVAITQYFYNADAYFHLLEECARRHITIPIIPGIMPIYNFSQLSRFSEMCGAEIPRYMRKTMEGLGDDVNAIQDFGVEVVSRLCATLLKAGALGLHFYTLNKHSIIEKILKEIPSCH